MADVSVDLELNAKQAKNELSSFEGTLKGFAGSVKNLLGGFAAGFAGAFSLGAIKDVITSTIHYGSTIQDLSDKYHVGTTFLQRYGQAAEKAGASQEALAKSLKFLEVNQAKALHGDPKAIQKFADAGIGIDELRASNPEELFQKVSLAGLDAAEMVGLLGKGAIELVGLFDQLRAGTTDLNVSIISPEDVALLDKFDDTIKTVENTLRKVAAVIVTETIPAFADLLNKAIESIGPIKAFNEFIKRTDKTPLGEAAADPEDQSVAAIAKRHREEAGLPEVPDTGGTPAAAEAKSSGFFDQSSAEQEESIKNELDVGGADRESKLEETKDAAKEAASKDKEEKDTKKAQEKKRELGFKRANAEEIRNPGGLTLHDIATSNILGPERAKAQEAERAEADAKRHQLSGEKGLAQQDRARADKLKEQLGVKGPKDEFKDALNESEVLKKIEKNTGGGAANK